MKALEKILLVDDSQPFNYLSRAILKDNKVFCQVDEVLNGKAALEYLEETDKLPDVILLDINMPVMDCFEFLEEYEKNPVWVEEIKLFILTSSNREEDRTRAMHVKSVKGYYDKPLSYRHIRDIKTYFNG